MNALRNFAKSVFAHIFTKFEYCSLKLTVQKLSVGGGEPPPPFIL